MRDGRLTVVRQRKSFQSQPCQPADAATCLCPMDSIAPAPNEGGGVLLREAAMCYRVCMINPTPLIDEDAAEAQALAAAIAEADADPRAAPHDEVRAWLLRIANGEFDAPPPEPR
jgi:hypothetical protein